MVLIEDRLVADKNEIFSLRLCYQQTVKRIAMMSGQKACPLGVIDGYGKLLKAQLVQIFSNRVRKGIGIGQLANA